MCGIVGIYLKTKKFEKNLGKMLSGMLNNMESRGPDSAGFAIYKNSEKKGAQIDLIIDREDNCINLCEIKFHQNEFCINSDYAKKLEHKKFMFQTNNLNTQTDFISNTQED